MTLVQLVILPGILLALFLMGLTVLGIRLTNAALKILSAKRALNALPVREYERLKKLTGQQHDVIAWMITEIESHPAMYEIFPQDLREAIYAAYAAARKEVR